MTTSATVSIEAEGRCWRVDLSRAFDLSIPLLFNGPQPSFFAAPPASATPYAIGSFTGDVRTGASCNCATYTLTPHCNGTHTESAGHLLADMLSVQRLATDALMLARLITVPVRTAHTDGLESDHIVRSQDLVITREALARNNDLDLTTTRALIIRTTPNPPSKRSQEYNSSAAPYFTRAAMQWIVERGIEHVLVDVPSLDRADDGGALQCHRVFFGMPDKGSEGSVGRPHATVTELTYIDDAIVDGAYALSLQIAPFVADAAPSRPLIYPVTEA